MNGVPRLIAWLEAERAAEGADEAADATADAAFSALLSSVPRIEASPAFVARAQQAVLWRQKRHAVSRLARVAAGMLIAVAGCAAIYWLLPLAARGGAQGVIWSSQLLASVATSFGAGLTWWSVAADVAGGLGKALAQPHATVMLIVIESIAAAALYMLQRLLVQGEFGRVSQEAGA